MLLLGRDVDSRFVFLVCFFFPNLPGKAMSWPGQCSHVWMVLGSGQEPPVLQLPALSCCCRAGHADSRHRGGIVGNFEPFSDA